MRMLVFGGTIFVSKAVAAEAVRRGHDVVCAARGTSGAVPDGATLARIDRDAPDALADLVGERFDAVVDTSIMSHAWVTDALAALGRRRRTGRSCPPSACTPTRSRQDSGPVHR